MIYYHCSTVLCFANVIVWTSFAATGITNACCLGRNQAQRLAEKEVGLERILGTDSH